MTETFESRGILKGGSWFCSGAFVVKFFKAHDKHSVPNDVSKKKKKRSHLDKSTAVSEKNIQLSTQKYFVLYNLIMFIIF